MIVPPPIVPSCIKRTIFLLCAISFIDATMRTLFAAKTVVIIHIPAYLHSLPLSHASIGPWMAVCCVMRMYWDTLCSVSTFFHASRKAQLLTGLWEHCSNLCDYNNVADYNDDNDIQICYCGYCQFKLYILRNYLVWYYFKMLEI